MRARTIERREDRKRLGRRAMAACLAGAVAVATPAVADPVNVSISATTGVHRDENFFRNSVNVEEKDLGSVGLTFRIGQERPRLVYDLQYVPSFQREFDSPHFTAEDHRLEFAASGSVSERTRLRLNERLIRSDVQTDLLSASSSNAFLIVPRTERFEHALHLGLARDIGRRNGIEVGLFHELFEYETTQLFDGTVFGGSLAYSWRQEDASRFDVLGRLLRHESDANDATDIGSVGISYRKTLDRWHDLVFDLGGFQARGSEPGGADETEEGWYGGVAYSWGTGRWATSRAALRRDVAPAPGVGFSTVADLAQLTTTLTLRERVRLDLIGQGTRYRALFESEQETDTVLAGARLRWEVRPAFELIAGIGRIHQRSDVPHLDDLDYNQYHVGTSIPLYRRGRASAAPGPLPAPGPATGG